MTEEQWRSETKELLNLVSRLQEENRRLARYRGSDQEGASPEVSSDGAILQSLRSSLEKQRDELKQKEKLLQDRCGDVENVSVFVFCNSGISSFEHVL